jgi:hypothetical protein
MHRSRPSPALVISCLALFVALGGTAVAAVSFATNAGAVDGKSAVASGATLSQSNGKLVATQRSGTGKGKLAAKYLDIPPNKVGSSTFGRAFDVVDNATSAPVGIGSVPGIGALTASCIDQNQTAAREDPATTVVFANTSGTAVNLARTIGSGTPEVTAQLPNTINEFTIGGSNTFELHVQRGDVNYLVRGVVRQDGRNTDKASCLIYGFALSVAS